MHFEILGKWLCPVTLLTATTVFSAEQPTVAIDARYPAMAEWAKAGVTGGIPASLSLIATVKPGDDVQAAINGASPNGGVIAFAPGEYVLTEPLRLRSGILLRGANPRTTKLHLKMRGTRPPARDHAGLSRGTTGVLLQSVERAGLANFTIVFDESLPPPPDPRTSRVAYADDPNGQANLHVVSVRFFAARDCWIQNCTILNSGSHPLIIEASRHVTVDQVTISGAYNKGPQSGCVTLAGSEFTLLDGLTVRDVNYTALREAASGQPCRHNVMVNARIEGDIRFRDPGTANNLLQNCVIAVPAWHNRPALTQRTEEGDDRPPGPGNLLYLCTVTRSFMAGGRSFSLADNPTRVYRVLEVFSNEASVADAGPEPVTGSLWLAR